MQTIQRSLMLLFLVPFLAYAQYGVSFTVSRGNPTIKWIHSTQAVEASFRHAMTEQWTLGILSGYEELVLNRRGYEANMIPIVASLRYFTAESGTRGYFEVQGGLVWRKFDFSVMQQDPLSPGAFVTVGKSTIKHLAPQYSLGAGISLPALSKVSVDFGLQIDVSPKGLSYSNVSDETLPDGFSQTRLLVGAHYSF